MAVGIQNRNLAVVRFSPLEGAKLAKRAQWAKQRARFGAAVKIFKALCRRIFWVPQETSPERKVSNPYPLAPASDSPFEKGE